MADVEDLPPKPLINPLNKIGLPTRIQDEKAAAPPWFKIPKSFRAAAGSVSDGPLSVPLPAFGWWVTEVPAVGAGKGSRTAEANRSRGCLDALAGVQPDAP